MSSLEARALKVLDKQSKSESRAIVQRLSEIEAKPINWLWPGRVAKGKVSLIAGMPGLGKSQITASLAAIVTTGGQWPVDRGHCEQGSVLFLSAEDDPADTIRPRMEAASGDVGRVHVLHAIQDGYSADGQERHRSFNLKEDIKRLELALVEIGDVSLVVIDPLTAYLGGTDSHNNADVRALLAPLSEMAARQGVAVVVVSHLNKGGAGDAMLRITGSLAFVAAARAAYIVAKDPENDSRRLFIPSKNNNAPDNGGLAYRIESRQTAGGIDTSCVVWDAEPVRDITADEVLSQPASAEERSALEDAKGWLLGMLADGPVPAKQISAEGRDAGHADRTIFRARKALNIEATKDGVKGPWLLRLPPKAAKHPQECQVSRAGSLGSLGNLQGQQHSQSDTLNDSGDDAELIQ